MNKEKTRVRDVDEKATPLTRFVLALMGFWSKVGKYFLVNCKIQICKIDKYRHNATKIHKKERKICVKLIKTIEKCKIIVYYETTNKRGDRKKELIITKEVVSWIGGTMIDAKNFT